MKAQTKRKVSKPCPFKEAILKTRNWLNNTVSRTIPGGNSIYSRYQTFQKNLPDLCKELNLKTLMKFSIKTIAN